MSVTAVERSVLEAPGGLAGSDTVVLLVSNNPAVITGGVSAYVWVLKDLLSSVGIRVVELAYPAGLVRLEARQGLGLPFKILHTAFAAFAAATALILRIRYPRVLVHSHSASFCLLAAWMARHLGCAAIHTFHSPTTRRSWVFERLTNRMDAVVHVSRANEHMYADVSRAENSRTLIIPGTIPDAAPRTIGAPKGIGGLSILYLGRVVPEKGVDLLLRAAGRLLGDWPTLRIDIVGPASGDENPTYQERLKDMVDGLALGGHVHFVGTVDEESKWELLARADVVALPSRWQEPAGIVAIEASASGTPVVAARIGGLPEFVREGETGLLFRPEDSDDLAHKIDALLSDPALRRRLGEAGRAFFERELHPAIFLQRHLRMYSAVLSGFRASESGQDAAPPLLFPLRREVNRP